MSVAFGLMNCGSDGTSDGSAGAGTLGTAGSSGSGAGTSGLGTAGAVGFAGSGTGTAGFSAAGASAAGASGFGSGTAGFGSGTAGAANGGAPGFAGATSGGAPGFAGAATGGGGTTGTGGKAGGGAGGTLGTAGATGTAGKGGTTGAAGANGTAGAPGTAGATGTAGAGGGTTISCTGATLSGGTQHCSNSTGNIAGGYSYQSWSSGTGTGCMTPYGVGAAFKANWANVGDYLARVGLGWDTTKTFDQLGTISADYAYTKTGSGGGFSFIGIYGWSENPLVEYYIVDDWFGSGPPTGGGTLKGTFTVDGGTYKVYTHTQTNQPAITGGNATFPQFFSIRQTARQCGHISISEHFKEWATLGMTLGKMEEARILVEVGGGTGTIDYTAATLTAK